MIAIIGAGVVGCTVARAFHKVGHKVMVFDDGRPNAASKASAFLLRREWMPLEGHVINQGWEQLQALYRIIPVTLFNPQLCDCQDYPIHAHRLDPSEVLTLPPLWLRDENVKEIGPDHIKTNLGEYRPAKTIICAGYWSKTLLPQLKLDGRAGTSYRWAQKLALEFVSPWAPYKQIVGYNISDEACWVGDGTAIKPQNWAQGRAAQSRARCATAAGLEEGRAVEFYGVRPYAETPMPILEKIFPNVWVATGTRKNGTILSGYIASTLLQKIF